MNLCEICKIKEVKYTKICKSCSVKKAKSEWPKEIINDININCAFCGNEAKYQFKNGTYCCSKGAHLCPETRRKNSENSKGKPSGMLGKHHSEETKNKLRKEFSFCLCGCGERTTTYTAKYIKGHYKIRDETRQKLSDINMGKKMSETARKNLSESIKNSEKIKEIKNSQEYKDKMSLSTSGEKNGNYKGLYEFACFDTCYDKLYPVEELKRNEDNPNIAEGRCKYCNKWFKLTSIQVSNRYASIIGRQGGDNNFYCSDDCKNRCPIFGQYSHYKDNPNTIEVDPILRKMTFERDNWECQKCGKTCGLECHHVIPKVISPMMSNDIDNCIILCSICHEEAHLEDGCKYHQLRSC